MPCESVPSKEERWRVIAETSKTKNKTKGKDASYCRTGTSGSLFDMNDDVTEVAEDVGASIV